MSLLFRSRLLIGIEPDRLIFAGQARGLGRSAEDEVSGVFPVEAAENLADWTIPVEALPAAMAQSGLDGPDVTVVLSNHYVRYVLLPANDAIRKDEEWLALARHRLVTIHGAAAEGWRVRVSAADAGVRVASAVDAALIQAIHAAVEGNGARLVSVQPGLMAVFNRVRRDIGEESCWIVIRETGRLTLALLDRGIWRAIRTRHVDEPARTPLPEILEREAALLALEPPFPRAVLYMRGDFAINGRDVVHVPDWTLAIGEDFQLGSTGERRSKAPVPDPASAVEPLVRQ